MPVSRPTSTSSTPPITLRRGAGDRSWKVSAALVAARAASSATSGTTGSRTRQNVCAAHAAAASAATEAHRSRTSHGMTTWGAWSRR